MSIFDNLASFSPPESIAANQMIRLGRPWERAAAKSPTTLTLRPSAKKETCEPSAGWKNSGPKTLMGCCRPARCTNLTVTPSGGLTARPIGKLCQLTRLPMPFASWSAPASEAHLCRQRSASLCTSQPSPASPCRAGVAEPVRPQTRAGAHFLFPDSFTKRLDAADLGCYELKGRP